MKKLNERESKLFTPEYQKDVVSELRRGNDFAYSYNETQYKRIGEMAKEIAEKKTKKTGVQFKVHCVNFGGGENEKTSIVGWKVVQSPELSETA